MAIAALPRDLDPELVAACEARLIRVAETVDAAYLRRAGLHVLELVAPEVGEAALAARLEREEALAAQNRYLSLQRDGTRVRLTGSLDAETAAILRAAIDSLCRPLPGPDGGRDPRTAGQRRADTLRDVCELALSTAELPDRGGVRPQLTVTMRFDAMRALVEQMRRGGCGSADPRTDRSNGDPGLFGVGALDDGDELSPGALRRIACDARIIPAILGGDSAILDLGRGRRLWTHAARAAIILRDGGCAFAGCDRPARWCDVHHRISWLVGGLTDLDNGVLLCGFHHRLIHNDDWQIRLGADRRPDFIPPAHVDPQQRSRRNTFHRRP